MSKSIAWKRGVAIGTCGVLFAAAAAGGFAALPSRAADTTTYTVDLEKPLQEFDGWGLSLSWWATEIGDWTRIGSSGREKREEIVDALYGEDGLNLNIARYNVGGGDDPTHIHMTDDRNTPGWKGASKAPEGDPNAFYADEEYFFGDEYADPSTWADWQEMPDYRQLWVLDRIQHDDKYNQDLNTEFYSNSPPYWMTMTGCSSGGEGAGQNLTDDDIHNEQFVKYFLDVYEYLVSQGFHFENLQPFNESGSKFWGKDGSQEGCYFSPQQKVNVLGFLVDELAKRGIDVNYNWGDETNTTVASEQYSEARGKTASNGKTGAELIDGASRFTYHIYWYDVAGVQRLYRYAKQAGQELYMSEIAWTEADDNGEGNYDPNSLRTGFKYTQSIIDTVKHGGSDAFVFWQGVEDLVGQRKGGTNYGLIQGVYYTQEEAEAQGTDLASLGLAYQDYVLSKAYYLSGQYTKYIRPGYRMVDVNDDSTMAAVSPDGETVVVVKQNNTNDGIAATIDLNGFKAESVEKVYTDKTHNWAESFVNIENGAVKDTVGANSVTTYIIHGKKTAGLGHYIDDSAFQTKNDVTAIASSLAGAPEVEQACFTGFSNDSESASLYYRTNHYTSTGVAAVRFYGTGIGVATRAKSDSGDVKIWIDPEDPANLGDPTFSEDNRETSDIYRKCTARYNELELGWHTAYIGVGASTSGGSSSKYLNLDGVFIYEQQDVAPDTSGSLDVTSVTAVNGTVEVGYTSTYDNCKVYAEWMPDGAKTWTRSEQPLQDDSDMFNLNAKAFRIRLVAVGNGGDVAASSVSHVQMLYSRDDVLYFADCGAGTPNELATGALLGKYQRVSDQKYTEGSWGYVGNYTKYYETYEAMTSVFSTSGISETTIQYKFTMPDAGNYDVLVGFTGGPSDWGSRSVKLDVTGASQRDVTINGGAYNVEKVENVTTSEPNGVIDVTVTKNSGDAMVSAIIILEHGAEAKLPLYTTIGSNYSSNIDPDPEHLTIGTDTKAVAEAGSFDLYYVDGSHETITSDGYALRIFFGGFAIGDIVTANYAVNGTDVVAEKNYSWYREGADELYYNIDIGFTGTHYSLSDGDTVQTPPDDAERKKIGKYQSTTHDQVFGNDPGNTVGYNGETVTQWGYVGDHYDEGVYYGDNKENKWSIREGMDSNQLVYKMTGFQPNEVLKIQVAGHCSNWTLRTFSAWANGKEMGEVDITSTNSPVEPMFNTLEDGSNITADENGELEVTFKRGTPENQGVLVGYIKVWSRGDTKPAAPTPTVSATTIGRGDNNTLTVGGLLEGGWVYIFNESNELLHSFKATETSMDVTLDFIPSSTSELHIVQAKEGSNDFSDAVIVSVPRVDCAIDYELVQEGGVSVVLFTPHAEYGVTSLTLIAPNGVEYNLVEMGFYYRATSNGTYRVVLVTAGIVSETEFEINNIVSVPFKASYEKNWTTSDVAMTFAPDVSAYEGVNIQSFAVNGQNLTESNGKYTFTATEKGTVTAVLTLDNGMVFEESYEVLIDRGEANVDFNVDFTKGNGVTMNFDASNTLSGGTLYVKFGDNAEKAVTDLSSVSMEQDGTYVFRFVSGTGKEVTRKFIVTHDASKATLASVSISKKGAVSVDGDAKLYRAGEEKALDGLKAPTAGKYYLEITKGDDKEVVVFTVEPDDVPMRDSKEATGAQNGVMIAGIVVGCTALAAAAVVCVLLVKKGRKIG